MLAAALGHDGVAVTLRNTNSDKVQSAAIGGRIAAMLTAVALTAATAGMALAQNNPAPSAGVSPPGGAVVAPQPPGSAPPATPAAPVSAAPASGATLPPQPPPVLPAPPTEKRGFLNDFGKWWSDSIANFNAKMKDQQTKLDEFNKQSSAATKEAVKNAADAMSWSHMIEIHEVCATAGNGAPDCAAAATNACKGKGYNSGQPLDIRTAEKCTASLWMSGQGPAGGNCPVESVVLRAACR